MSVKHRDYSGSSAYGVVHHPARRGRAKYVSMMYWPMIVLGASMIGAGAALILDDSDSAATQVVIADGSAPNRSSSLALISSAYASPVHSAPMAESVTFLPNDPSDATAAAEEAMQAGLALDYRVQLSPAMLEAEPPKTTLQLTVKSGDTLSGLFERHALPAADWMALAKTDKIGDALSRIRPGDILKVSVGGNGAVDQLDYPVDLTRTLRVTRRDNAFETEELHAEVRRETAYAVGEISSSLFLAAADAGLEDKTTMELANIFGWDIDFALDIRQGDQFAVVYEERYVNDERIANGNIIAAEFINNGRVIQAVRYEDTDGDASYYTPEGRSMRKAFLRTPVDFTRISSHFNPNRRHPVLNRIRAHKGVDYAAPRGTPIKTSGDGKVIFAGTKGGYGRTVIIQHGERYTTLYAHMNSYARGVRTGSRVRQGQVIGYVGSSGLASGPHLHYEFRVNGVHRNPVTVALPRAIPVPDSQRARFEAETAPLMAQLATIAPSTQVAQASSTADAAAGNSAQP